MGYAGFSTTVNQRLQRHVRERVVVPSKPLYHYTTVDALAKIMESQRLWATNVRYLNDPTELDHTAKLFREVLENESTEALSERGRDLVRELQDISKLFAGTDEHYVVCFSENPDAKTLWTTYARAEGVAFALDASKVGDWWSNRSLVPFLRKVIYDEAEQSKVLKALVSEAIGILDAYDIREVPVSGALGCVAYETRRAVSALALQFKSKHFVDEQEWRAVYASPRRREKRFGGNLIHCSKVKFRGGRDTLIPYLEVDLRPEGIEPGNLPVTKFVYGWRLDKQLAELALGLMCEVQEYDGVEIQRSEVPIR
jgi:hypothetical protein